MVQLKLGFTAGVMQKYHDLVELVRLDELVCRGFLCRMIALGSDCF